MEDITDADYAHTKRVCKDFEIKDLGEYQDLYVQSNTLLLADIFENFRNMCLKIYGLDPTHFLSTPGLAWQAALKIDSSKIRYFSLYRYVINGTKRCKRRNVSLYLSICKS